MNDVGANGNRLGYDPATFSPLTFHDRVTEFRERRDDPVQYLERCISVIDAREPVVQAFVTINRESARAASEASAVRWKAGEPLSPIDGMPVGIKDLYMTKDMPTQMGSPLYAGRTTDEDSAPFRHCAWRARLSLERR